MGIGRSDLLVVNKIDLAPYVEVNLDTVRSDLEAARGPLPFIFTDLKKCIGMKEVTDWIEDRILNGKNKDEYPVWWQKPTLKSGISEDHHHHDDHKHDHTH